MKAAAWRTLAKRYLLPALPNVQLAGSTLVVGEVGWILHALVLDTSAFSATRIQISALNLPLYVPGEGMRGDYGEDLRHPISNYEWWDVDPSKEEELALVVLEAIKRQALPFLARTPTPADLAVYSEKRYPKSINPPNIEVEAYSWALAGNMEKFMAAYRRLESSVATLPPTILWGKPIMERAHLVRDGVGAGPDAVQHLLGGWREESVRRYKLEKLARTHEFGLR
jgi:hypothetical protein